MIGVYGMRRADAQAPAELAAIQGRIPARYRTQGGAGPGGAIGVAFHAAGLDAEFAATNAGHAALYGNIDNLDEFTDLPQPCANAAEFLLQLHAQDSLDRLARANGQFCAALYDRAQHRLTLVTDRLGTLPIHVWRQNDETVFATQPWALLGDTRIARRADAFAAAQVYALQRTVGATSSLAGVEAAPPGSIVTVDRRGRSDRRYAPLRWTRSVRSRRDAADHLASALRNATRRQSRVGRIGLMLSGGLDSRVVLASASRPPLCWTTAGAGDNPELRIAIDLAASFGAEHKTVLVRPEETLGWTGRATETAAGLFPASQNFAALAAAAHADADVALTGHAIDYLLRGMYLPARFLRLGNGARLPALAALPAKVDGSYLLTHLRFAMKRRTVDRIVRPERRAEFWERQAALLEQWLAPWQGADMWDALLLNGVAKHYTMTGMMAVRAEMHLRVPAFDAEVVDIALSLPPELRVDGRIVQLALRRLSRHAARRANANTGLAADLHPWLEIGGALAKAASRRLGFAERPKFAAGQKEGGWPDLGSLYRGDPGYRARFSEIHGRIDSLCFGWFDPGQMAALIDEHLAGAADHAKFLRQMLSHDEWVRTFGIEGHA